jgi:hypothetical protein
MGRSQVEDGNDVGSSLLWSSGPVLAAFAKAANLGQRLALTKWPLMPEASTSNVRASFATL